jgi:hypothetical protein
MSQYSYFYCFGDYRAYNGYINCVSWHWTCPDFGTCDWVEVNGNGVCPDGTVVPFYGELCCT